MTIFVEALFVAIFSMKITNSFSVYVKENERIHSERCFRNDDLSDTKHVKGPCTGRILKHCIKIRFIEDRI